MRSHNYEYNTADVIRLLAPVLAGVAIFAVSMHAAALLELLPRPRPNLDVDRTIIIHKAEASSARSDAQVLLAGDSSCLMDVAARRLSEDLGRPALNLGTLSYLDLQAHATLVNRFADANPGQLKMVVLLLHPEALRRPAPEAYHTEILRCFLAGDDHVTRGKMFSHCLGLEIFRGRLLSRAVPTPLSGAYGRFYGFSSDLENYLTRNGGSAVDPEGRAFKGSPEYRLAAQLQQGSQAFKAAIPPGVKLLVGITPVPAGFAGPGHAERHRQMLRQWREWLQADAALEDLPSTLPDHLFSKTTHLNEASAAAYTALLGDSLRPLLQDARDARP